MRLLGPLLPLPLLLRASQMTPHRVPPPPGPYLLLLGTAQDGGYPQIGCRQELCRVAREDPVRGRRVVSALVVAPEQGRRWLVDATPDLPAQIELARGHGEPPRDGRGRPPLFDGIFLTHAHIGHYTGLMHLGREAYGSEATPTFVTASMGRFLRENGPWSLLVEAGHLELVECATGEAVELVPGLSITPLPVPHRGEYSDTVAFLIRGPRRTLLYLPDIDSWEEWQVAIEDLLREVDVALVDGTFFGQGELPGRDMNTVPHPLITSSMARFAPLPVEERAKVRFFHLNHTNPALDPWSDAAARIRAAGMAVARDGEIHEL